MTNGDCFSPPIIFVKTLCRTPLSQTIADSQLGEEEEARRDLELEGTREYKLLSIESASSSNERNERDECERKKIR